jgi:hypothetical protein
VVAGVRVADGPAVTVVEGLRRVVLVDFEVPQAASAKATATVSSRRARPVRFIFFTLSPLGVAQPDAPRVGQGTTRIFVAGSAFRAWEWIGADGDGSRPTRECRSSRAFVDSRGDLDRLACRPI